MVVSPKFQSRIRLSYSRAQVHFARPGFLVATLRRHQVFVQLEPQFTSRYVQGDGNGFDQTKQILRMLIREVIIFGAARRHRNNVLQAIGIGMGKAFEYRGFYIFVYLERFEWRTRHGSREVGYVPVIQIAERDRLTEQSSRIRVGNVAGSPFGSADAAMDAGGTAARKIIADLTGHSVKQLSGWKELSVH
ncbi:protein of unknown function (plasmid) [Pararobbsia alpina]|uniref:hypothetical protein n=1 Tax=Pararobbsia alpina TaxID=621374 RepID=UPI0039A644D6